MTEHNEHPGDQCSLCDVTCLGVRWGPLGPEPRTPGVGWAGDRMAPDSGPRHWGFFEKNKLTRSLTVSISKVKKRLLEADLKEGGTLRVRVAVPTRAGDRLVDIR